MKKILILVILITLATSMVAAGGFDWHLGAGYHSSYVGDVSNLDPSLDTMKSLPLGVGGYLGVGYGFGEKKMLALGLEYAPSWDFSIPTDFSNFSNQGRIYMKFKPMKILTLTGFGGVSADFVKAFDSGFSGTEWNPVFGGRLTALFLYAEYDVVLDSSFSSVLKHEIGLGVAFKR